MLVFKMVLTAYQRLYHKSLYKYKTKEIKDLSIQENVTGIEYFKLAKKVS